LQARERRKAIGADDSDIKNMYCHNGIEDGSIVLAEDCSIVSTGASIKGSSNDPSSVTASGSVVDPKLGKATFRLVWMKNNR
jgi:hypothetical protein